MKPSDSTTYLLRAVQWLDLAIWWRKEANEDPMVSTAHVMLVAEWARDNFQCWKRQTFRA